ncbi:MAG: hypothetical protein Q8N13_06110 [Acidovorax sp.]|nr:hypothetical protein [Acidovorax sp.]
MQAKLGTGQVQGKQTLVCTGHPHLMARTQGGHQHTGIGRHHTPPLPAGYKGIRSREQARIELVQGIPIEVAAGFGKGAVRDTAHVSGITKTKTKPRTITAQAAKEAVQHDLLERSALADQGPDEVGQGQFAAAREGGGC